MENSILTSTKKLLGIAADYTAFDLDILMNINGVLSTLTQLGVGPEAGFQVDDDTAVWDDFEPDVPLQGLIRTYVPLKVRMQFDPPTVSHVVVTALLQQIEQLEWRINVSREHTGWTDPLPPVVTDLEDDDDDF